MTNEDIMKEIESSLTGDPVRDEAYLRAKAEQYGGHESADEILMGIGRLMFEGLPEEQRKNIVQSLQDDARLRQEALEDVRRLMADRNHEEARLVMEGLVARVEEMGNLLKEDGDNAYLCLRNRFEEALYYRMETPGREVRQAPEEAFEVHMLHGEILSSLDRPEEAEEAFQKASACNPVAVEPLMELAGLYRATRRYPEYLDVLRKSLARSIRPKDIARVYRALGYYYSEHHQYDLAIALYFASLRLEKDNSDAQIGLHYISEGTCTKISEPDQERTRELFEGRGIPFGPDETVLQAALAAARQAASEGAYTEAREYFGMVYRLSQDEKVREWIEELPREDE